MDKKARGTCLCVDIVLSVFSHITWPLKGIVQHRHVFFIVHYVGSMVIVISPLNGGIATLRFCRTVGTGH